MVSVTAKLQWGSPVHAIAVARSGFASTGKPIAASAAVTSPTRASGTFARMAFCCFVNRTSAPASVARSAIARSWSACTIPSGTGTPTWNIPGCYCSWTPMWSA